MQYRHRPGTTAKEAACSCGEQFIRVASHGGTALGLMHPGVCVPDTKTNIRTTMRILITEHQQTTVCQGKGRTIGSYCETS